MAIKAKNITIRIRSLDQGLNNFAEAAEALLRGEPIKKQRGVYFENLDSFCQSALKNDPLSALNFDPPLAVVFSC